MATKLPLSADERLFGLSNSQAALKRSFDVIVSLCMLVLLFPFIIVLIIAARMSTGEPGLFKQKRVGLFGNVFTVLKIRSMRSDTKINTKVTTKDDPRITPFGAFVRNTKLDEFPQLLNVLKGDMSFVGPRPDMASFYESLNVEFKDVLCIRPGITGPASVQFRDEEQVLAEVSDPETYNRDVIFPEKLQANRQYIQNYSLWLDLQILFKTVF